MANSPTGLNRPRSAFTLVELLVVVGIIVVLIAILLPALNRARDAALTAVCMSNLRQCAQGELIYATNNQNKLMLEFYYDKNSPYKSYIPLPASFGTAYWSDILAGTRGLSVHATSSSYQFFGPTYLEPAAIEGVRSCPKVQEEIAIQEAAVTGGGCYGTWHNGPKPPQFTEYAFTNSNLYSNVYLRIQTGLQTYPLLVDTVNPNTSYAGPVQYAYFKSATGSGNPEVQTRHNNGTAANIAFLDGHVESLGYKELSSYGIHAYRPWPNAGAPSSVGLVAP